LLQVLARRKIGAIESPQSEKPIEGGAIGFLGVVGGYNDAIVAAHQRQRQTEHAVNIRRAASCATEPGQDRDCQSMLRSYLTPTR
jgi:hypothetical protein